MADTGLINLAIIAPGSQNILFAIGLNIGVVLLRFILVIRHCTYVPP